jgi:hypothetical protein
MWQSIICDTFTVAGVLLCLYVSEKTGSTFFTTLSLVGLVLFLIPFGGNKKKFRSRQAMLDYLTDNDFDR